MKSAAAISLTGSLNTPGTDHKAVFLTNGEALITAVYDGNGGNIAHLTKTVPAI